VSLAGGIGIEAVLTAVFVFTILAVAGSTSTSKFCNQIAPRLRNPLGGFITTSHWLSPWLRAASVSEGTSSESGLQAGSPCVSGSLLTGTRKRVQTRAGWNLCPRSSAKAPMTDTRPPQTSSAQVVYQSLLGIASGFSLGWFAWIVAGRQMMDPPFWPFAAVGIVVGVVVVRMAAATPRGRKWVHALWIPVVAFVFLMTAVILALRKWGS
jgi:hypothetical protein